MKSVADALRSELLAKQRRTTVAQRIALALELGRDDVELYRRAHKVSARAAEKALRRRRQVGRQRSACMDALLS